ncbi:MAG: nucleotidyltransferase substrate binding protein [Gammaproteobacteria bacterium]|nr:nucleotidyltransferase substrate binding protein [Gammaproteobacteria bacterium]
MLYLNTDHLNRCRQTLESSLEMYQSTEKDSITQEIFRNAIIKGYELTQETVFKLLKKALKVYGHSGKKLDAATAKEILRLAATHSLLTVEEVERWFVYRDNRNSTGQDYGVAFATQTLLLIPGFPEDVDRLARILEEKLGKETDV